MQFTIYLLLAEIDIMRAILIRLIRQSRDTYISTLHIVIRHRLYDAHLYYILFMVYTILLARGILKSLILCQFAEITDPICRNH